MIAEERKWEIVAAFQRRLKKDNSKEIQAISLSELREADELLGQRDLNTDFRISMRNRIADLQEVARRDRESKLRAWNYIMGLISGLLIAGAAKLLFS